jgi:O-acetylserine/cysteine efflux transporter
VLTCLLPLLRRVPHGQWPRLVAVCLLNGALHFGLNFMALRQAGDISSVAIALQSYVPMSALLAVWLLGERIGWRTGAGIGLAFGGVLVLGFDPLVLDAPAALLTTLAAAFALALGTVLMRGLRNIGAFELQAWTAVFGIPFLLVLSAAFESGQLASISSAGWGHWGAVAYSGLAASLVGHGLLFWLVQRHPVSQITPYLLLTPIIAIALGVLVWGDRPGPKLVIGGLMVLGGVMLIALRAIARRRSVPLPQD